MVFSVPEVKWCYSDSNQTTVASSIYFLSSLFISLLAIRCYEARDTAELVKNFYINKVSK
jgi:hypothetical protein